MLSVREPAAKLSAVMHSDSGDHLKMFRSVNHHSLIGSGFVAWAICLFLSGCGGSEPGLVKVSGKITLDGGAFPKEGLINFTASGGLDQPLRPGSAKFGPDGAFTAMSFDPGDGLYPGTYKLSVDCLDAPPTIGNDGRMIGGKSLIPAKFQNPETSGLTLTVPAEGLKNATIDLKTK
jgi:hypothetical protein